MAAELSDNNVFVLIDVNFPCAASKATMAQRFFAPEGGPDCVLWTAQSFALRRK